MTEAKKDFILMVKNLSYQKRKITLASGRDSDFYVDLKNTILHPKGVDLAATLLSEKLQPMDGEIAAVGGLTMGADPIVTATSMKSLNWKKPLMAFYIRKEPKLHGTSQWIEGLANIREGSSVWILEDVVTSGGSSLKAVERARESGLKVMGILACVDREEGGREKIESQGLRFMAIATKSDILSV